MPRIFDNIHERLLDALTAQLAESTHADFCVGYFNLRGWAGIASSIDTLPGLGEVPRVCRLLVGMQRTPAEEVRLLYSRLEPLGMDGAQEKAMRREAAEQFRRQLTIGPPTDADEQNLRRLLARLKAGKIKVKLHLDYPLHAKLYLAYQRVTSTPVVGFLGSSNLTLAGLRHQGEFNLDVTDQDAAQKLLRWFEDRWNARRCSDITQELIEKLEESWIAPHTPYEIYLKILHHLSRDARGGVAEFKIHPKFRGKLLKFQEEAVQRAARQLQRRNGVIVGDVVGLGKTITACALAKMFENTHRLLIICPANLVPMWEAYDYAYDLGAKIVPLSVLARDLPDLRPYNLIIVDESHNLRNPESKRYKALKDYLSVIPAKMILLSATPYNKAMTDLSAQLRLFLSEDEELGVAPERAIEEAGGRPAFSRNFQGSFTSVAAFEKSAHPDDWRELMRQFQVRRSRKFIKEFYSEPDPATGRRYLLFPNGERSYFPDRLALKMECPLLPEDPYGRLYSEEVVAVINSLDLARYGLGLKLYHNPLPVPAPLPAEAQVMANLGKAGVRLKGFARTNLFKRLESSGHSFLLSVERQVLRNLLFIYAIEQKLPLPIGEQDAAVFGPYLEDGTRGPDSGGPASDSGPPRLRSLKDFERQAALYYKSLATAHVADFSWISSHLFSAALLKSLNDDAEKLISVLARVPRWEPAQDRQLAALRELAFERHTAEKVLVFTQYADTADYLHEQLRREGSPEVDLVTGATADVQAATQRFSPVPNLEEGQGPPPLAQQSRVLIATDVLSEGQNLQDAHIVVNYDLPWAIIRMIQRAGRVDRIGQQAHEILCYSFLPESGLEKILKLRSRLKQRLEQSDEVIGSPDEIFFEDQQLRTTMEDLYRQRAGMLDEEVDDSDIASYAYRLWVKAKEAHPDIARRVEQMPPVVYAAKRNPDGASRAGAIVYTQTGPGADALTWISDMGHVVTTAQMDILKAAQCEPHTPGLERAAHHHDLVETGLELLTRQMLDQGGQIGRPSSIRHMVYHRMKAFADGAPLTRDPLLDRAIDQVYARPLKEYARDTIGRHIKTGIRDADLAKLVCALYEDEKLCIPQEEADEQAEPLVICSLGLI